MRPEIKRRLSDAAVLAVLGLVLDSLACRLWGAHRAGAVDPFGYAGGWTDIAFTYSALPMLIVAAVLGGSGRCPPKSIRAFLLLALTSALLLAGVQFYTRNIELGELPDPQGGLTPAAENARC